MLVSTSRSPATLASDKLVMLGGAAIEPARQGLVYVLEFFINRIGGPKTSLEKFTLEEGSLDEARAQAKSIMRNIKFDGAMANLCVVRAKGGAIVCEVKPEDRRP